MEAKREVDLATEIPSVNMSDLFFNYGVQVGHTEREQVTEDAQAFAETIGRKDSDFVDALVEDYFDRM